MAKVKIQGNASGTGVLTVEAPNTNTDRTITLPDSTGTLVHKDSSDNVEINKSSGDLFFKLNGATATHGFRNQSDGSVGLFDFTNSRWLDLRSYSANDYQIYTNGSSRLQITSDGRGLSQFTAKAWALWNGTGTPDFRDSHNCSSISDEATGTYKVHFTNNMGSSDYSASFCCQVQSTYTNVADNAQFDTSTSSYFYCAHKENGSVDPTYASMIIFGD